MMGVFRQIYCSVIVSCMGLNLGIIMAWPSSTINLFSSTNTTLNRPMTETEVSLLGSLSSIAAVVGTPLTGMLLDLLGRKYCCILFSLAPVISWTIVSFSRQVEVVLFSVFVSGFLGTAYMIVPIFISEFSEESIRGTLSSGINIFSGLGLMVSYLLGGFLSYRAMIYVCLTISVVTLLLLGLVRESPVHLMKKGLEKETVESICFYRSVKPDSKTVLQEIEKLKRILNPQLDDAQPEEESLKPESSKKLTKLQFIRKSKSTVRGFLIVSALLFLTIAQGIIVVQVYAEPLFQEALPNMSARMTSVSFAVVNVLSAMIGAYLVDLWGRRPMLIYPSLLTGMVSAALGAQIHLQWAPSWAGAVLVFLYCIVVTCGANIVPFVVASEIFLPEVRGLMTMLAIEFGWIWIFLILIIFNPLVVAVGLGPVFYIFALVSLLTAIFTAVFLPETKGLSVDVIQTMLTREKRTSRNCNSSDLKS